MVCSNSTGFLNYDDANMLVKARRHRLFKFYAVLNLNNVYGENPVCGYDSMQERACIISVI